MEGWVDPIDSCGYDYNNLHSDKEFMQLSEDYNNVHGALKNWYVD